MHANQKQVYQKRLDNEVQPRSRNQGQSDLLGYQPIQPSPLPVADCIHLVATGCNY